MEDVELNEILERTCINKYYSKYYDYKGCFLSNDFEKYADDIYNLDVYDSDVWATSFPKTGSTWSQEMIWLIANDLNFDAATASVTERIPLVEFAPLLNRENFSKYNGSKSIKDTINYVKNLTHRPRVIKTHLPWNLLPRAIQMKEKRPKIIHVIRNPKDACVSYYHHHKILHDYTGTFEEFCKLFLSGKVLWGSYWNTVLSYWDQRDESNILFIYYEDMKKDLKSVVLKVADFLNKKITEEQMEKLLKHLSFDSMKNNPACNLEEFFASKKSEGTFIRKGTVGDHKNIMSPEIVEAFDDWIKNNNRGVFYNK